MKMISFFFSGWVDDSSLIGRRVDAEEDRLGPKYNQGAFTTGRRAGKKQEPTSQRSQVFVVTLVMKKISSWKIN